MPLPTADAWFDVAEVAPGVFRITEPHAHRLVRANCFLITGGERDILVDSGLGVGVLRPVIAALSSRPLVLFTTHCHVDHIGGHPEFPDAEILVHAAEAEALRRPGALGLRFPPRAPEQVEALRRAGIELTEFMVEALPAAGFDPETWQRPGVEPSRLVGEGEVLETGAGRFEVLHLPGHSPGGIALWDAARGHLFSGDVIYDGVIIDSGPGTDVPAYIATMRRLRALPVQAVFGGHKATMDQARFIEVIDSYIQSRTR